MPVRARTAGTAVAAVTADGTTGGRGLPAGAARTAIGTAVTAGGAVPAGACVGDRGVCGVAIGVSARATVAAVDASTPGRAVTALGADQDAGWFAARYCCRRRRHLARGL